ncbi:uncharacterized protein BDR25DRAFT_356504 [Lindgomyces ingoldianus]|uniref:Uncharacterized protein n=1 Tax=Lindgomyces ingoldianus TaxID=673940 RepID=A0ACB6QSI1_9PLEO|nr:uncharacterized protein BDR25DRAFT_356504 [Lindgomyces ingoldianus]KAF2469257.1 hypothetical protein BDR25DRAFT_356504 [Lindgomyces ingoldianus]
MKSGFFFFLDYIQGKTYYDIILGFGDTQTIPLGISHDVKQPALLSQHRPESKLSSINLPITNLSRLIFKHLSYLEHEPWPIVDRVHTPLTFSSIGRLSGEYILACSHSIADLTLNIRTAYYGSERSSCYSDSYHTGMLPESKLLVFVERSHCEDMCQDCHYKGGRGWILDLSTLIIIQPSGILTLSRERTVYTEKAVNWPGSPYYPNVLTRISLCFLDKHPHSSQGNCVIRTISAVPDRGREFLESDVPNIRVGGYDRLADGHVPEQREGKYAQASIPEARIRLPRLREWFRPSTPDPLATWCYPEYTTANRSAYETPNDMRSYYFHQRLIKQVTKGGDFGRGENIYTGRGVQSYFKGNLLPKLHKITRYKRSGIRPASDLFDKEQGLRDQEDGKDEVVFVQSCHAETVVISLSSSCEAFGRRRDEELIMRDYCKHTHCADARPRQLVQLLASLILTLIFDVSGTKYLPLSMGALSLSFPIIRTDPQSSSPLLYPVYMGSLVVTTACGYVALKESKREILELSTVLLSAAESLMILFSSPDGMKAVLTILPAVLCFSIFLIANASNHYCLYIIARPSGIVMILRSVGTSLIGETPQSLLPAVKGDILGAIGSTRGMKNCINC